MIPHTLFLESRNESVLLEIPVELEASINLFLQMEGLRVEEASEKATEGMVLLRCDLTMEKAIQALARYWFQHNQQVFVCKRPGQKSSTHLSMTAAKPIEADLIAA